MFALVDCNNFYASCERVFNPKLRHKPVVVLSNNDGCVIARSQEAKDLGFKMGDPYFQRKEFIKQHNVEVFSSNYTLYGDMSARVMNTLKKRVENVEVYSIDESFLSFHGYEKYHDLESFGQDLRREVYQNTGIPVGVGIAPTKTLAKVANKLSKKAGGCKVILTQEEIKNNLTNYPIEDLWGIGRQYAKFLQKQNIKDAYELSQVPETWAKTNMTIQGLRMVKELKGYSCIPLEEILPIKKGICSSKSFPKDIDSIEPIREAISNFSSRCAEKLRKHKLCAGILTVALHTNKHKEGKQYHPGLSMKLPSQTNSTVTIAKYAQRILKALYKEEFKYKKAMVMVTGIIPESEVQLNLFEEDPFRSRHKEVMLIMDKLNMRYGTNTVRISSMGFNNKEWGMKRELLSPSYTTRWKDLIIAK